MGVEAMGFVPSMFGAGPATLEKSGAIAVSSRKAVSAGRASGLRMDASAGMSRRDAIKVAGAGAGLLLANGSQLPTDAEAAPVVLARPNWEQVNLDTDATVFDVGFSETDPLRGWLVGSKGLVMETTDGGVTWKPRAFQNLDAEEEFNYRFETVSFYGKEGWVIGKPSILLKTRDGGKSWERVPLSPKLPGEPVLVTALGPESAEMTTTAGAVYKTDNGGRNWKAQVKETIDATLNRTVSSGVSGASYFTGSIISVLRDRLGSYIAISSRGNFFLTWQPGQDFWIPHGRDSSRRIQAMGFVKNDISSGLWMSTRGGSLTMTSDAPDLLSTENVEFKKTDLKSGGYGILDVGFRPNSNEAWAALGGGNLFYSSDGGRTFTKDKSIPRVGANLYKIKFINEKTGFILGANGVLLRYTGYV